MLSNKRLIVVAHVAAVLAFALAAVVVTARQNWGLVQGNMNRSGAQNSNSNSQNSSSNRNSGNSNSSRNDNGNAAGSSRMGGNTNNNSGGTGSGSGLASTDRKFVMEAAMGGMAEVELGRVAVERASSDSVKQFGQRMIDDHTRANEELMQLASSLGVTLPTALDAKHQALLAKMSRLSGAAFDREYMKQMVKDHEKSVALFQREATRGSHADLKSFASQKLPTLQEHLQMARSMAMGGKNRSTSNSHNMGASHP